MHAHGGRTSEWAECGSLVATVDPGAIEVRTGRHGLECCLHLFYNGFKLRLKIREERREHKLSDGICLPEHTVVKKEKTGSPHVDRFTVYKTN